MNLNIPTHKVVRIYPNKKKKTMFIGSQKDCLEYYYTEQKKYVAWVITVGEAKLEELSRDKKVLEYCKNTLPNDWGKTEKERVLTMWDKFLAYKSSQEKNMPSNTGHISIDIYFYNWLDSLTSGLDFTVFGYVKLLSIWGIYPEEKTLNGKLNQYLITLTEGYFNLATKHGIEPYNHV